MSTIKEYQLIKEGLTVDIAIGDSTHWFTFFKAGVNYEYHIKSFRSDFKAKAVVVEYSEVLNDSEGNLIRSKALSYTEQHPLRYAGLYALNGFTEAAGDFYGKQCINGVMERTIGFKAFDNAGAILAPGIVIPPPEPAPIG